MSDSPLNDTISLAELTAGHVSLEWHESVACAQAICAAISKTAPPTTGGFALFALETDPVSATASHLKHISLRPDGHLHVDSFDLLTEEESVRVVASLLNSLQVRQGCPQAMHTVIDRAMTVPPMFKTVQELSTALSYFERPNRQDLLRTIYQRAHDARPSEGAVHIEPPIDNMPRAALPAAPDVAPLANTALPTPVSELNDTVDSLRQKLIGVSITAKSAVDRVAAKSRIFRPLLVGVVVSAIGGLVWYSSLPGTPVQTKRSTITPEAPVVTTADAAQTAATPAVPPPPPKQSLGIPVRVKLPQQTQPSPAQAFARRSAKSFAPGPAVRASSVAPPPVAPAVAVEVPVAESASPTEPVEPPSNNQVARNAGRNVAVDEVVYSANDPDVTPPVRVYPARAEATGPKEGAAIQIVTDKDGRVKSAVLTRRPATMAEAMLATMRLAAAKTWRFQPAVKNGSPVSYRQVLWLADR